MTRLRTFARAQAEGGVPRLEEIEGQDVIVHSWKLIQGKLGDYAVITIELADGSVNQYRCGGMFVLDALVNASAEEAFPLEAKFTRTGRAWIVE